MTRRWWPLGFYRVAGNSMMPTYASGATLVGWRWFRLRPGQVVVVRLPERPVVKRVKSVAGDAIWIEGDNTAHSTDSRQFGPVSRADVEAVIVGQL